MKEAGMEKPPLSVIKVSVARCQDGFPKAGRASGAREGSWQRGGGRRCWRHGAPLRKDWPGPQPQFCWPPLLTHQSTESSNPHSFSVLIFFPEVLFMIRKSGSTAGRKNE